MSKLTMNNILRSYIRCILREGVITKIEDLGDDVNNINWRKLSYQKLSEDFIRKYQDKFDWQVISQYQELSEDFIREFQDKVDWTDISRYQKLSEDFIREFQDKVDWGYISQRQKLSEDFIREFQDKVDWDYISIVQKLSEDFIFEFIDEVDLELVLRHQKLLSEDFIEFIRDFYVHRHGKEPIVKLEQPPEPKPGRDFSQSQKKKEPREPRPFVVEDLSQSAAEFYRLVNSLPDATVRFVNEGYKPDANRESFHEEAVPNGVYAFTLNPEVIRDITRLIDGDEVEEDYETDISIYLEDILIQPGSTIWVLETTAKNPLVLNAESWGKISKHSEQHGGLTTQKELLSKGYDMIDDSADVIDKMEFTGQVCYLTNDAFSIAGEFLWTEDEL